MSETSDSPFVPGARVAVRWRPRWSFPTFAEDVVARVYKTGNFTLASDPKKQWRPRHSYDAGQRRWEARPAGDPYGGKTVLLWDDRTEAEVKAAHAKASRQSRLLAAQRTIERLRVDAVTDDMLDQIEAALAPLPARQDTEERT